MTTAETYRLFVNDSSTVLVRIWNVEGREIVEVAIRDFPDETWGPPIQVEEEK